MGELQHFRTLKILAAVKAGCQPEMSFQKGTGLPEQRENTF